MPKLYSVTKDVGTFAAAHALQSHEGKCRFLHGHNYGVQITMTSDSVIPHGTGNPSTGMVRDFGDIKDLWKILDARLDHALLIAAGDLEKAPIWEQALASYLGGDTSHVTETDRYDFLDEIFGTVAVLPIEDTTAECLAGWIFDEMSNLLAETSPEDSRVRITKVVVSETPTSWATVEVPYAELVDYD